METLASLRGVIGHPANIRTDKTARSAKEHNKSKVVNFLVFVNSLALLFEKKNSIILTTKIVLAYR